MELLSGVNIYSKLFFVQNILHAHLNHLTTNNYIFSPKVNLAAMAEEGGPRPSSLTAVTTNSNVCRGLAAVSVSVKLGSLSMHVSMLALLLRAAVVL